MAETKIYKLLLDAYRAGYADGLSARHLDQVQISLTDLPIEVLGLSARPFHALQICGCARIADVIQLSGEKYSVCGN